MKIAYLIKDKRYTYDLLSLDEFNERLETLGPHSYHYDDSRSITVYEFSLDGKTAAVNNRDNSVSLYESITDFLAIQDDADKHRVIIKSILFGKNPYGPELLYAKEQLIREFFSNLGLEENVSLNIQTLFLLDNCINQKEKNRGTFLKRNMLSIITIIGDMLIRDFPGAKWMMELSHDQVTWEPYLYFSERKIPIFVYLIENIKAHKKYQVFLTDSYHICSTLLQRANK